MFQKREVSVLQKTDPYITVFKSTLKYQLIRMQIVGRKTFNGSYLPSVPILGHFDPVDYF